MRYHYTFIGMVKYKNLTNQSLAKMRNNRNSHSVLMDCRLVESLCKQFLTELNVVIPHNLTIIPLDSSPNDLIANCHTKTYT